MILYKLTFQAQQTMASLWCQKALNIVLSSPTSALVNSMPKWILVESDKGGKKSDNWEGYEVSRPEMDTFSSAPTSPRIWNTWLVQDDWQIQVKALAIFLVMFKANKNILFINKVRFLFLLKRSHRFPQLCWLWSRISSQHMMSFW